MSFATLRARMGVTAAFLTAGLAVTMTPAMTSPAVANPSPITATVTGITAASHHHASNHHASRSREAHLLRHHASQVHKVMAEARRQKGKPYSYGSAGPHSFDCSGLVMYVFQHAVHRSLPHNAAQQYHSLRHIKKNQLRRGDLIFTDNGYISHVGIFAGHHHWWVAPQTGERVHKQRIYHAHFVYARVLWIHKH